MTATLPQMGTADTPQPEETTQPSKVTIIRDIYNDGGSDVEVASALGLTLNKFYELCDELPELNTIVELGRTIAEAWWMAKGRGNLWNKEFNSSLYNFQMKNRYGWADKVDTGEKSSSEPTNIDAQRAELSKLLKKLAKKHPEVLSGANLNSE